MIKRIIFDIDGTLIRESNFRTFITEVFKNYGIEDIDKINLFIANISEYENNYNCYDRNLYLKFFSNIIGIKLDYNFLKILFQEAKKSIPNNSILIRKMLSTLSEYELVLLSNFFEESQRNRLTAMGINDYFSEYYGEKIIKPNKQVYMEAKGKHEPEECLIVGNDKQLDIDIPKSLGFKTLYVNDNGDIKSVEMVSPRLIKRL